MKAWWPWARRRLDEDDLVEVATGGVATPSVIDGFDLDRMIGAERGQPAEPSDAQSRAIWAQLQVSLALGAGAATAAVGTTAAAGAGLASGKVAVVSATTKGTTAAWSSITTKVLIAVALTGGGSIAAVAGHHSSAPDLSMAAPTTDTSTQRGSTRLHTSTSASPPASRDVVEAALAERGTAALPGLTEAPAPKPKRPDAAADLALLRRAQAALGRGATKQASSLLATHARQYPGSAFAEEREALRIIALCKLRRLDAAESKRKRFVARWPSSIYEGRLEQACSVAPPPV